MKAQEIKKFIIKCFNQINDNLFFNLHHVEDKQEKEIISDGMGIINKCQDEICKEEPTAQEMFEKLGYEKQESNNSSIVYIRRITEKEHFIKNQIIEVIIQFWQGSILCYEKIYKKKKIIEQSTITFINMQVLKAINQQCKELRGL